MLHNEAVGQVQTLLSLLEALMLTLNPSSSEARSPLAYERNFLYCLAWSLGGLLEPRDRSAFDGHLRALAPEAMPQVKLPGSPRFANP